MGCLKCGRDLERDGLFCDRCLEIMDRYPVPISTVVTIPRREEPRRFAPRRKMGPSQEEQIHALKVSRRILFGMVLVLLLLVGGLVWSTLSLHEKNLAPKPGQNYSSMDSAEETQIPTIGEKHQEP